MRGAALPQGGKRQYTGGYSSHRRGISGYKGNTQIYILYIYIYIYKIYMLVVEEGHAADWNAGS
jgi:hypothetical protein